jgi:hypothetical protein
VILADVSRQDRFSHVAEWRATVRETAESLHSRNILWRDVNAHNVVVDREMGAWLGWWILDGAEKGCMGVREKHGSMVEMMVIDVLGGRLRWRWRWKVSVP